MSALWSHLAACVLASAAVCHAAEPAAPTEQGTAATTQPAAEARHIELTGISTISTHQRWDRVALAVSPNNYLAAAYNSLIVWKLNASEAVALKDDKGYPGEPMVFSPDGSLLACLSRLDTRLKPSAAYVRLWEIPTGRSVLDLPHPLLEEVKAVAFSPRGAMVATASWAMGKMLTVRSNVRLWSYPGGQLIQTLAVNDPVYAATFSPDETTVALACGNRLQGYHLQKPSRAVILDIKTGQERRSIQVGNQPVIDVAFSADGKQLLTMDEDHRICGWDAADGHRLYELPVNPAAIAVTPDRQWVITTSTSGIEFWDSATGAAVPVTGPGAGYTPRPPILLAASPTLLLTASSKGPIQVWSWTVANPAAPR